MNQFSPCLTEIQKLRNSGSMNGTWKIEKRFWNESNNVKPRRRNKTSHHPPNRSREEKNLTDRRAIDTGPVILKRWEPSILRIITSTERRLFDNNVTGEHWPRKTSRSNPFRKLQVLAQVCSDRLSRLPRTTEPKRTNNIGSTGSGREPPSVVC